MERKKEYEQKQNQPRAYEINDIDKMQSST